MLARSREWAALWESLPPDDRLRAAHAYADLIAAHPSACAAVDALVAAPTDAVAGAGPAAAERATRLASAAGLPAAIVHNLLVAFHRRWRLALVTRFLDVAGIAHREGLVDVSRAGPRAAPVERLRAAVRAVRREHPAAHVRLFLDVLRLQAERPWERLAEALASGSSPPGRRGGRP